MLALVAALVIYPGGCQCADDIPPMPRDSPTASSLSPEPSPLIMNPDFTVALTGRLPDLDEEVTLTGTWSQDGPEVTLEFTAEGETETETGEYEDGELDFGEVVWAKEQSPFALRPARRRPSSQPRPPGSRVECAGAVFCAAAVEVECESPCLFSRLRGRTHLEWSISENGQLGRRRRRGRRRCTQSRDCRRPRTGIVY